MSAAAPGKRVARVKLTIARRAIDSLEPAQKPWIAWDDRLTGFGVQVHPSGVKSYIVNYRPGDGGRTAPNKRLVIGRCDRMVPEQARREAHRLLGMVAVGEDPAADRAKRRRMPPLRQAFEEYMAANPKRRERTNETYRDRFERPLGDWLDRPLDAIARSDVEGRFNRITEKHGWATANQCMSLLRSVYRRPCVDYEGLANPVDLWIAGGGRFHRKPRRKIPPPAEVLPCWRKGIEAVVGNPALRDVFWFGMYTGMRLGEVLPLRWERVNREGLVFRVEETKTGAPLELPVTRQTRSHTRAPVGRERSPEGRLGVSIRDQPHRPLREADLLPSPHQRGRGCEVLVPRDAQLLHHGGGAGADAAARPDQAAGEPRAAQRDVTEGYAADWTIGQLREPAQRIADRIEALMSAEPGCVIGGAIAPAS